MVATVGKAGSWREQNHARMKTLRRKRRHVVWKQTPTANQLPWFVNWVTCLCSPVSSDETAGPQCSWHRHLLCAAHPAQFPLTESCSARFSASHKAFHRHLSQLDMHGRPGPSSQLCSQNHGDTPRSSASYRCIEPCSIPEDHLGQGRLPPSPLLLSETVI